MTEKNIILVVEDNDFVRLQIVNFLQAESHETIEASDGRQAYELIMADNRIAMAIVDIRMEPVGGFEFIKQIRQEDIHTPVVLVTGDQTADLLEQAGKFGVAALLMKPVEKDRLLKIVERILSAVRRKS